MPPIIANIPGIIASFLGGLISPVVKLVKYLVLYKLVSSHIRGKIAESYNAIRERQLKIKSKVSKSRSALIDIMKKNTGF